MRLLRIRVQSFGPLSHLDTGEAEPLPSLVAVLGPNEAGKSAFHQAIVALLYGFYPASRDTNPWAPWSGQTPELEAWIDPRMDLRGQGADDEPLHLHRRLLSRPDGTLTRGDVAEDLRNHEFPGVAHVDLKVFHQVYALTLADLAGLESEGWDAVQDRLVVGMGARDLRAPREAAEALEAEADTLWRPTRRGNPRFRELEEERETLRQARRQALDRDLEVRELHRKAGELEEELEALRAEGVRLDRERTRIARLGPLAERLGKLEELARHAGSLEELEGLPADPAGLLAELEGQRRELEEREERLEGQLQEARERAEGPGPAGKAILDRKHELRPLADRAPVLQEREARRMETEGSLERLDRQVREVASPLFQEGTAPEPEKLAGLSARALRNAIDDVRQAEGRLQAARDALHRVEARPLPDARARPPASALLTLGLGGVLLILALGVALAREPGAPLVSGLLAAGLLTGAAGGIFLMRWKTRREVAAEAARAREGERSELERRIESLGEERLQAQRDAARHLDPLPLREPIRLQPDEGLVRELERLRDLFMDRADTRAALDRHRKEDQRLRETLNRLRDELKGLSELPDDPVAALPALARLLDDLSRHRDTARTARREVERLQEELERVRERAGEVERRRSQLLERLRAASGVDGDVNENVDRMVERTRRRLDAARTLEREREELRRDHPELEREQAELRRARNDDEPWLDDPEFLTELEGRRSEVQEQIEEVRGEVERLRERIRGLEDRETADLIDGRLEAIEEEMVRVRRKRDRHFVLARAIRVAERRFREAHQPELLRRAGAYLSRITDGRYPRLLLGEVGQDPFLVAADHLPGPQPADAPLSTGTREQIYLALRLAIVDHLDRERTALPLFFDEILVNWDGPRRQRGLELLAELGQKRQIFFFTCHPDLAQAVDELGGSVIRLPGPVEGP